jgi:hypothetical protein
MVVPSFSYRVDPIRSSVPDHPILASPSPDPNFVLICRTQQTNRQVTAARRRTTTYEVLLLAEIEEVGRIAGAARRPRAAASSRN